VDTIDGPTKLVRHDAIVGGLSIGQLDLNALIIGDFLIMMGISFLTILLEYPKVFCRSLVFGRFKIARLWFVEDLRLYDVLCDTDIRLHIYFGVLFKYFVRHNSDVIV